MRLFLLALMVVLLPLRGWVGDAMAQTMATGQLASATTHHRAGPAVADTAHTHAIHPSGAAARAATDCAGHSNSGSAHSVDAGHCDTCGACQVCHTLALEAVDPTVAIAPDIPAPALLAVTRFTSADRALRLKPPIS